MTDRRAYGCGFGNPRVDPPPVVPSAIDRSRIADPKRLEPRRVAAGADWKTVPVIYTLDGGGSAFVPDLIGADARIMFPCSISSIAFWTADDVAADIEFDLWLGKWGGAAPTVADTILSAPIALTNTARWEDSILDGVSKSIEAGSVLKLFVDTCADITRAQVIVTLERSI